MSGASFQERREEYRAFLSTQTAMEARVAVTNRIRKERKEDLVCTKRQRLQSRGVPVATDGPVNCAALPLLAFMLHASERRYHVEAARDIRKLLCAARPPIDEVVGLGLAPVLAQLLHCTEDPGLQLDAAWALTNIASGTSAHTKVVIDTGAVPTFVALLSSPNHEVREQVVWGLGNIAGDSALHRDVVVRAGTVPALARALQLTGHREVSEAMALNVAWTLCNLCHGKPSAPLQVVQQALGMFSALVFHQDDEVLTETCRGLCHLLAGPAENVHAALQSGVVRRLVDLLHHPDAGVHMAALRAVGRIVAGDDDLQTQIVVNAGAVPALVSLLRSPLKAIRKDACTAITNIGADGQHQIQAILDAGALPVLVDLVGQGDMQVRLEAMWALRTILDGTPAQVHAAARGGVMPALVGALSIGYPKVLVVALDALSVVLVHDVNGGEYAERMEEAGLVDRLELMAIQCAADIANRAAMLLDRHFS